MLSNYPSTHDIQIFIRIPKKVVSTHSTHPYLQTLPSILNRYSFIICCTWQKHQRKLMNWNKGKYLPIFTIVPKLLNLVLEVPMKIWNVRQPISTGDYIQKVFGQKFPKKAILQPWRSVFGWANVISNFRGWLKSAQIYMVERMGWNFDVFPGFQKIPCCA